MPDFYAVEVKTVDRHRVCFSQISNLFTGFFTEFAGISQKGIPKMEGRRKGLLFVPTTSSEGFV